MISKEKIERIIMTYIDIEEQVRKLSDAGINVVGARFYDETELINGLLLEEHFDDMYIDLLVEFTVNPGVYSEGNPLVKSKDGDPVVHDAQSLAEYLYANQKNYIKTV